MKNFVVAFYFLFSGNLFAQTFAPTSDHRIGKISDFTVLIHKSVERDENLYNKVLNEIKIQLNNINASVPDEKLVVLKNVPLWFGCDLINESTVGAEYHPSEEWLRGNGRNPQMAGGIQVSSSARFLKYSEVFPWMLMHEFAHAYEFRVLGPKNFNLRSVYNKQKRLYNSYHGTNHHEYFAELTEAYFGRNDTYPFDREDLKKHDPLGYNLLLNVWGNPKK